MIGHRRILTILLVATVLAFALRLGVTQFVIGGLDRPLEADESAYVSRGLSLAEGRGLLDGEGRPSSVRVPGLPLMVAALTVVTDDEPATLRVAMCLLASLVVPASYLLGHALLGPRGGWVLAAIAAVYPSWVFSAGFVMTDAIGAVLVALLAWLLIEGTRRRQTTWLIAAGVVWGVATLTRAVSLAYLPGIVLWLVLMLPGWGWRVRGLAAVCVPLVVCLVPWTIRNAQVQGGFVLLSTQSGPQLFRSNNPRSTGILSEDDHRVWDTGDEPYPTAQYPNERERSRLYKERAMQFIRAHPGRFLGLCGVRFVQFWKFFSPRAGAFENLVMIASFGLVLPLFVLEMVRRGWRRGPALLLVLMIACQTAVHTVFSANVRYRVPIEPFILVLGLGGLFWLVDQMRGRPRANDADQPND